MRGSRSIIGGANATVRCLQCRGGTVQAIETRSANVPVQKRKDHMRRFPNIYVKEGQAAHPILSSITVPYQGIGLQSSLLGAQTDTSLKIRGSSASCGE